MEKKIAIVTGITGQDGSYLAELLLEKDYIVFGLLRRSSDINTHRINHLYHDKNLILRYNDLSDTSNFLHILSDIRDNYTFSRLEVYNLAAMSHVKVSFEMPEYTGNIDGLGTLRILEAIRCSGLIKKTRFYQASTSELYGKVQEVPQTETTSFYPRSPYGVAKLYAYWIVKNYREAYNMFACNGILFNHESPRRGPTFVTRKITKGLCNILNNTQDHLLLGNLDSKRDWGHARDYVYGMWLMLQADVPDDFVLSTNEFHSVREFIEYAFSLKKITIKWEGSGIDEIGINTNNGKPVIKVSEKYFRPTEVDELLGCSKKAETILGWKPRISFKKLVEEMVDNDCDNLKYSIL